MRITTKLAPFGTFVVFLPRIFLRNPYTVKIEEIVVAFSKPQNNLVASAEAFSAMQPVTISPDNPIPQRQTSDAVKYVINEKIKRHNNAGLDMIANLPTYASAFLGCSDNFHQKFSVKRKKILYFC